METAELYTFHGNDRFLQEIGGDYPRYYLALVQLMFPYRTGRGIRGSLHERHVITLIVRNRRDEIYQAGTALEHSRGSRAWGRTRTPLLETVEIRMVRVEGQQRCFRAN